MRNKIKIILIPIIEYEVYHMEKKEKLDLNICKDLKMYINIPVKINENTLFKYNTSSEYYNDICYSYTTENKTDIILKDRREEYINNNMSLCENNCDNKGYNTNTKKVLCECNIKTNFMLISEEIIGGGGLLKTFKDVKNLINLNVMKCYYTLFTKEMIIKNIGNYVLSIIILFNIVLCIIFKVKGYYKLKNQIDVIIKNKKVDKDINTKKTINNNFSVKEQTIKKGKIKIIKRKKKKIINKMKTNDEENDKTYVILDASYNKNNKQENIYNILLDNNSIKIKQNILTNTDNIRLNDYEINKLEYIDALKFDKRTYI